LFGQNAHWAEEDEWKKKKVMRPDIGWTGAFVWFKHQCKSGGECIWKKVPCKKMRCECQCPTCPTEWKQQDCSSRHGKGLSYKYRAKLFSTDVGGCCNTAQCEDEDFLKHFGSRDACIERCSVAPEFCDGGCSSGRRLKQQEAA
jgi:hypothetical protein